jgi:hypothetical protein
MKLFNYNIYLNENLFEVWEFYITGFNDLDKCLYLLKNYLFYFNRLKRLFCWKYSYNFYSELYCMLEKTRKNDY